MPEQVSEKLGVSTATLRKWRCLGQGPKFLKVGRKIHYPPEWVEAFVNDASEQGRRQWEQKNSKVSAAIGKREKPDRKPSIREPLQQPVQTAEMKAKRGVGAGAISDL